MRAALGVVSKLPAVFPSPKLNRSFRVYHISCYWMNIQVDPTSSNLASAMLNSKIRPRAVGGYGVKIFHPSPPNYVTRSPGICWRNSLNHLSVFERRKPFTFPIHLSGNNSNNNIHIYSMNEEVKYVVVQQRAISTRKQYHFGLLGLNSAVLMSGMKVSL